MLTYCTITVLSWLFGLPWLIVCYMALKSHLLSNKQPWLVFVASDRLRHAMCELEAVPQAMWFKNTCKNSCTFASHLIQGKLGDLA